MDANGAGACGGGVVPVEGGWCLLRKAGAYGGGLVPVEGADVCGRRLVPEEATIAA